MMLSGNGRDSAEDLRASGVTPECGAERSGIVSLMIADGVRVDLAWKTNVLSSTARIALMETKGLSTGIKDLVFHSKRCSTLLPFSSAEKSMVFFSVSRTVYGEPARANAGTAEKSCDIGVARRGPALLEDTEYTHGFENPDSSVRKTRVLESTHWG